MTWTLTTTSIQRQQSRLIVVGLVLIMLAMAHGSSAAQPVSSPSPGQELTPADVPPSPPSAPDQQPNATGDPDDNIQIGISLDDLDSGSYRHLYRVDDPERMLKLDQRIELADDAQRLTNHGMPTIVILRLSAEARDQSQITADQLRIDRGVESRGGADDGMVMLVTIDPASPRSGSVVLSFGRNALPKGGLTSASVEDIYDRVIDPRLARSRLYSALHVGIREIIYLETYIPEARPPMSDTQRLARRMIDILGPLVLVGSAAGFMFMSPSPSSGVTGTTRRSTFVRTAVVVGLGTVCLFVAAVVARSSIGIGSVVLLALLVWTQYLIARSPRGSADTGVRSVTLPYRRTFRPVRQSRMSPAIAGRARLNPRGRGR